MVETCEARESFSTKLGFVLASAASAVGLGNLWRFPYLAEEYGGGAFVLIYILLVVTFGFTLMLTEVALGRRTGKSCIRAFGDLSEKHKWIGWLAALVPIIIVPYYCVIGGWVLKYFFEFATVGTGSFIDGTSSGDFFGAFTGADFGEILNGPLFWFIIFVAVVIICVAMGVNKGIEKLSSVLLPALLILLIGITAFALIQPGSMPGIKAYLIPEAGDISFKTVLAAMGQLFYSLSLAMGIMITYGSYMKKTENIEKSVLRIGIIDTVVAFLCGLMIVPSVTTFGLEVGSGPGLMFCVLPVAFNAMGPTAGRIVGMLFFLLTFFAALTSAISLAEAVISQIKDQFGDKKFKSGFKVDRNFSVFVTMIIIVALGFLSCYGFGPLSFDLHFGDFAFTDWLSLFDWISNSVMMPIVAILTCLFIGFVVKPKFIEEEVELSGTFKAKKAYGCMVKYICPVLLLIVLLTGLFVKI